MKKMEDSFDHHRYNDVAVRTAKTLESARKGLKRKLAGVELPREKVFPSFNRPGLGVGLEYERMGSRPVSEELQARADDLGFEFEHLGITLGTVIHNIDLKKQDAPEETRFFATFC